MAQRFAIDDRDRILGLALLGSPRSLRGPRPHFAEVVAAPRTRSTRRSSASSTMGWSDARSRGDHGSALPGEPQGAGARLARCVRGTVAAEPPLDTGPISAPTLIAWGASDLLLPRADQEQWPRRSPARPPTLTPLLRRPQQQRSRNAGVRLVEAHRQAMCPTPASGLTTSTRSRGSPPERCAARNAAVSSH